MTRPRGRQWLCVALAIVLSLLAGVAVPVVAQSYSVIVAPFIGGIFEQRYGDEPASGAWFGDAWYEPGPVVHTTVPAGRTTFYRCDDAGCERLGSVWR